MAGWKIFIDKNNDKKYDKGEVSALTGGRSVSSLGSYSFDQLFPGTYQICEVIFPGLRSTLPDKSNCQSVALGAAENKSGVSFGNH